MLAFSVMLAASVTPLAADIKEADLVPFVLPWDDAQPGPTDVSFLNHMPAGKFGPIRAEGGHLFAGGARVRFLGVNICFAGVVPTHDEAEKVAGRMAKFGINAVRFHHHDWPFPRGIIRPDGGSGQLDPEAMDRLDYFIAQLKKHGIYADINLLVGRQFAAHDGLPAEIESIDWKLRHTIAIYDGRMIELQKQFARDYLGHHNPYTNTTYAQEPAVAFVEINNENGLIQNWLAGNLDHLPAPFAAELSRQWNAWLKQRYSYTAALRQAWHSREEPLGTEMLPPLPVKATASNGWTLEQHAQAQARVTTESAGTEQAATRIEITRIDDQAWHVQFNRHGLKVKANQIYTLSLRARADRPRKIEIQLGQAHEPWQHLGFAADANLTETWRNFEFNFTANADDDNARVNLSSLGGATGSIFVSAISLRPGGNAGLKVDEQLEARKVPLIAHRGPRAWPAEAQTDFISFLWDTEQHYWRTMRDCVKNDLGFKGIVIGTIVGCSTPNLQADFDALDGHSYWQHPHFPGRPWDPENWTVANRSMVTEPGGVLAGLSMQRVVGNPFTVTEYNHAAPNTYSSEAPLLLAAQAALQNWDAVFLFAYSHSGKWDTGQIGSFFDLNQHPTKMANLPVAAMMFRGGQVHPAAQEVFSPLGAKREPDIIRRTGHAWKQVAQDQLGVSPALSLLHRTGMHVGPDFNAPAETPATQPNLDRLAADTDEIVWDRSRKGHEVVTIDAPRCKALIGFADDQPVQLGNVTITPGHTLQGWCTATLTLVNGSSFTEPGRAILVATGYTQNTGMLWKNPEHSSVGTHWGHAPSLIEAVPLKVEIPLPPARVEAWALDEHGQRQHRLKLVPRDADRTLIDTTGQRTFWYEIVVK